MEINVFLDQEDEDLEYNDKRRQKYSILLRSSQPLQILWSREIPEIKSSFQPILSGLQVRREVLDDKRVRQVDSLHENIPEQNFKVLPFESCEDR